MKTIRQISVICLLAALLAGLAGCTSKKTVVVTDKNPASKLVERVLAAQPNFQTAIASRARLTLNYQQREMSANATISIYTDSAIVVSVQPFLGVELIRMELGKQGLTLVDKLNHRYCTMSFSEVFGKSSYHVTYHDIESLLTSRLFAVGHDTQWLLKTPSDIRQDGNTAYLSFAEQRLLHQFAIDNTSALINSTTLQLGNDNRLTVTYSNLADFSGKLFPSVVKLDVASALLSAACTIVLQSVSFDTKVNVAPANTSKYNKVNLSTIIPM